MKIIFYLAHPAHFHLFKNVIFNLKNNHNILVTIKTKDVLLKLLENSGIEYINLIQREREDSLYGITKDVLLRNIKHTKIIKTFKPDLFISSSAEFAPIAFLFRIPILNILEDDLTLFPKYSTFLIPFVNKLICPSSCKTGKWEKKTVHYNGNQELTYLHPKYFNPNFVKISHLLKTKRTILIRFSKLAAWHDNKNTGITDKLAIELIHKLKKHSNIVINSEKELIPELEKYRIKIEPKYMHDFIAYCDLLISDSQTMTAEAAILGTPSIRFNNFVGKLGYLEELENDYQLTYGIKTNSPNILVKKAVELITTKNLKKIWKEKALKFVKEKIDVTAFLTTFIEDYPKSSYIYFNNLKIKNKLK